MELILAKIGVSALAVIALAYIAEKVSPRAGGIMAGYPLGTAIALFFIGWENGTDFAQQAALYTLPGFIAAMGVSCGYYLGLKSMLSPKVVIAALCACLGFLSLSYLLSLFDFSILSAALLPILSIAVLSFFFRRIENSKVDKPAKTTASIILIRAGSAATMVLTITGIAKLIGPNWSGLLAAFPVSMLPFLILLHLTYGEAHALTVIKNFPIGLGALIAYTVSVYFSYPTLGLIQGTAFSYAVATLYLLLYAKFLKRQKAAV